MIHEETFQERLAGEFALEMSKMGFADLGRLADYLQRSWEREGSPLAAHQIMDLEDYVRHQQGLLADELIFKYQYFKKEMDKRCSKESPSS